MTSRLNKTLLGACLTATISTAIMLVPSHHANGLSILGTGDTATEFTQLANNAELLAMKLNQLEQIKNQLTMLEGFDLNNAQNLFHTSGQAQSLLGQLSGIIYEVSSVAGVLEERYPHQYPQGTSLEQLMQHTQEWREVERNAFTESHQLQSQIAETMQAAAQRDQGVLDASMHAPGIRSAIMAGNQLSGSVLTELRNMQLATVAHARAVETQRLQEMAKPAQRHALYCEHFKHSKTPFPGCEK